MQSVLRHTLRDLADLLNSRDISYAIIGGLAVLIRGRARFTDDIDAVIALYPEQAIVLVRNLQGTPFMPAFEGVEDVINRGLIAPLQHIETGVIVDLALGLLPFEQGAIARATPQLLGDLEMPVVTAEDLLVMKVVASRPRDIDDAREIVNLHQNRLDWNHIQREAEILEMNICEDLPARLNALREGFEGDE